MKKVKRKLGRPKLKKIKKLDVVREFLDEINYHAEQVSITLRHLANAIDNVRSYHLDKEQPATEQTYQAALKRVKAKSK
jgi:chromosomal replication initiation ATPase DnaA